MKTDVIYETIVSLGGAGLGVWNKRLWTCDSCGDAATKFYFSGPLKGEYCGYCVTDREARDE